MSTKRVLAIVLIAGLVMLAVGAGPRVRGNAPPVQAPDPNAVTLPYSGTLTDDAGLPVPDGFYAFAFTLYDAETDGEPLWTETQQQVVVKGGAFVALLGSANAIPKGTLDGDRWLQVAVRGPGDADFTALTPRQRVSAVSSAMSAGTAGTQACPHNHWGETWTGTGAYGLKLNNTADGNGGNALYAQSAGANPAIYATKDNSPNGAIMGQCTTGIGVYGYGAGDSIGVLGRSVSGKGVYGQSGSGHGVYGESTSGAGVYARGPNAVVGISSTPGYAAIFGRNEAITGTTYGLYGESRSTSGDGVFGYATATSGETYGVYGRSNSTGGIGVLGRAAATSGTTYGVYGRSDSPSGIGVYGRGAGAAIYGEGDVKQNRTGDGLVKAGVYMPCGNYSSCAPIRSFNNVTSDQIAGICGATGTVEPGWCTIDFNFDISDRYWVATADAKTVSGNVVLVGSAGVTCMLGTSNDRLLCLRYNGSTGNGQDGNIMVLLY